MQVNPEGWCASCKEEKLEDADRNDITTAQHIGLLVHSALPEEPNSMAAGEDAKETVMTIPFLQTCIINRIADLERKSPSSPQTVTREGHCCKQNPMEMVHKL